ncbi:hypothetical protein BXZ70DRAFT_1010641 [Cristinia sonorae]|uniref:BTB domain-containing protein n=1 Tax=Cristinia sonorae TaxID=1940300 RepID=A0A8K0UI05_9AGAR|nr:hypothetical protein BXZ70DRAFT_1010641 [Cristinia sonorae]
MSSSTNTTPTRAEPPFHGHRADVVLRTCDNVDFYAHMNVLSLASPFFDKMFGLPQADTPTSFSTGATVDHSSIPAIPFEEDSQTTDYLLRLLYPIPDPPPPTDLAAVVKVLEAAVKYEMEVAAISSRALFRGYVDANPLLSFALACRLHLEDEARLAARRFKNDLSSSSHYFTCRENKQHDHFTSGVNHTCSSENCCLGPFEHTTIGKSWVTVMKEISAGCWFRLLRFVMLPSIPDQDITFCKPPKPPAQPNLAPESPIPVTLRLAHNTDVVARWPYDIALQSFDGQTVLTHQLLLALGGATSILQLARDPECPTYEDVPLINVNMDGKTLICLIRICHPFSDICHTADNNPDSPSSVTPDVLGNILVAAQRYGMAPVLEKSRQSFRRQCLDSPLQAYFTAVRLGWSVEARETARAVVHKRILEEMVYVPQMEDCSAETLYRLYRYHHNFRKAGAEISSSYRTTTYSQADALLQITDDGYSVAGVPVVAFPVVARRCYRVKKMIPSRHEIMVESCAFLRDVNVATSSVVLELDEPKNSSPPTESTTEVEASASDA